MPIQGNLLTQRLKLSAQAISVLVMLTGLVVLIGWALDIQVLKSILPTLVTMKANTALSFILVGVSLNLLSKKPKHSIGRLCALAVALIGILTLSQYLFGWNLGIDQLLFKDDPNAIATSSPGRMAHATAISFILVGIYLLLLDTQSAKGFRLAQFFILIQGLISLLACIGHLYSAKALYAFSRYTTAMAVHTAAAFFILFLGILFSRPEKGVMLIFISDSPAGIVLRKLLPLSIFILILLGWLHLFGELHGFYHHQFGAALFVASGILIIGAVILDTARHLYQMDVKRKESEDEINNIAKFPSENPYPVLRVDKEGVILYANRACDLFMEGWKCNIGQYIPDFLRNLIPQVCESGLIMKDLELKSGERVFSFTLVPISGCTYINLYGVDITERKRIEEELGKANAELKKLDQLKSDFVSTVSHELRTPLSIVKESLSQVLEGLHGPLNEEERYFLSIATNNIERLSHIVSDLLDISKIEAGITLKKELVNAVELAQAVIFNFSVQAEAKGVALKENFSGEQMEVYVDKEQVIRVFTNLVANAIKFTEKGGTVTVTITDKEDKVGCSVSDTGTGISEEDLPKLFAKFQQLKRPDGAGEKGTGLGLAISKGIVELHQGKIWAESVLGRGTKISFTLPKL